MKLMLFIGTESAAKTECTTDNDCAGQLACMHGNCVNPCNSLPCGKNAYCEPENHAAWCRCAVGFIESPNGDCISRKYFKIFIIQSNPITNLELFFMKYEKLQ